jgi:hypothetical protein
LVATVATGVDAQAANEKSIVSNIQTTKSFFISNPL